MGSLSIDPASVDRAIGEQVHEAISAEALPLWSHSEWRDRFPWLVQGTTGEGSADDPFDLGVYGELPTGSLMARWRRLLDSTGMSTAVHSRQIHESDVAEWLTPLPPGVLHVERYDAHVTDQPGLLLSVSVADCVPVFIVEPSKRLIGLAHAGWRGVAASIVEKTIEKLLGMGAAADSLWLHCGPSICGRCYEVGPEVHAGVNPEQSPPDGPTPIDLRAAIARRAAEIGLREERISRSGHCTRCGPGSFFSHRAGSPARQMGVLGIRR